MSIESNNGSGGQYQPHGSPSAPVSVIETDGISLLNVSREVQFVRSDGGAIIVTASPRVQRGIVQGQELLLMGTSDIDTVTLQNGNGLLLNGACILKNGASLYMLWRGDVWCEAGRNDF